MPQLICKTCRKLTQEAYNFKTTCKKSDDALKLFLATGNLIKPGSNKRRDDAEVEKSNTKKRNLQEKNSESITKKPKPTEFVTLNYATSLDLPRSSLSTEIRENIKADIETERIVEMEEDEVERFEEIIEQNISEEHTSIQEQGKNIDDEDNINPILKVPQVNYFSILITK